MTQRRWLCGTCQREWLANSSAAGANPWQAADGCPGCHSSQIREVEYTARFPGADIPREHAAAAVVAMPEPLRDVQPPPRALEMEFV